MIKDILTDITTHTHNLGFLSICKVTGGTTTTIEAIADDRTVIMTGVTHKPVPEFDDVFGLTNMDKLNLHLKNPEYKDNAKISVVKTEKNGKDVPTGLNFENESGDFKNNYRFMSSELINEKLKSVKFKGAAWKVKFSPSLSAISRLKLQATAHSEESTFRVKTVDNDLIFEFGDQSNHTGSFVFESGITGKLKNAWVWPVSQVQSILNLDGSIMMKISDEGAMQITVDSGLAEYSYILPAHSK